jgi:hypothetical protein
MQLIELLPPSTSSRRCQATDAAAALGRAGRAPGAAGAVQDAEDRAGARLRAPARDLVFAGEDVVLPHYRTDAVDRLARRARHRARRLDARDSARDADRASSR